MRPDITSQKSKNWKRWLWLVPGLVFVTLPWPILAKSREIARRSGCQNNIKLIAMALRQYSKDFDDKYPPCTIGGLSAPGWRWIASEGTMHLTPAYKGSPVGWADALQPYAGSEAAYLCPSADAPRRGSQSQRGYTHYWLNTNIANIAPGKFNAPALTLLLGDGYDSRDNTDATYNKKSFGLWPSDSHSPMYRHFGGANYLFVDGHIQWLKPDEVQHFGGRSDPFAIK